MKKRILSLVLCAILLFAVSACTTIDNTVETDSPDTNAPVIETDAPIIETEPGEKIDVTELYAPLLTKFYSVIADSSNLMDFGEGELGVATAALAIGEGALDTIGYVFLDVNGDGIDELLIGVFEKAEEAFTKNEIYAAYTSDGESVKLIFEGFARNAYSLTEDNTFFNYGSAGAMYSIFAEYSLSASGELTPIDYYFTYEKDADMTEIGIFHNTNGQWDVAQSEEMDISLDEFWAIHDALGAKTVRLPYTSFSSLENAQ